MEELGVMEYHPEGVVLGAHDAQVQTRGDMVYEVAKGHIEEISGLS